MKPTEMSATPAFSCWEAFPPPQPTLLSALKSGPFHSAGVELEAAIQRLRREVVSGPVIFVGAGTCGLGAGAGATLDAIRQYLTNHQVDAEVVSVGCVGLCSEEPIVDIRLPDRPRVCFGRVSSERVDALLSEVLAGRIPADLVLGQFRDTRLPAFADVPFLDAHPFLAIQKRFVLAGCGLIDPNSIDEYLANGGYGALYETLVRKTPTEVVDAILRSGLRGRGGGGFPTGKKWQMAAATPGEQKYLICNADEGDPGAFMDRAVCESDPHRLLEGMAIAAYAIGASKAYIYIRAEYPLGVSNLTKAIQAAREYGLLGRNILSSGFDLDITIKMGAGAFVCGEETALMHSIEGKRGMPRPRPPYPIQSGLFGKPTVINNVETLACVTGIIASGADTFASYGTTGSKGTKVFALSGMVNRTGLVEVPMGTPIRDVVFKAGGGIPNGRRCKAVQIGGPSGGCIPEANLDLPCDYEALKNFGAIMGSGGLVVMDENTCMVDLARYFMEFIQSESCGKCIPCREGTRHMLEILQAITRPRHKEHEQDALLRFQGMMLLQDLGDSIRKTSLCGLGQTAPSPVLSTLRFFRDEYEAHIFERRCPAGTCRDLVGAPCQTSCPIDTEVWRYVAHISRGEYEDAYRVIRTANPFPSVCARVCNHPCEHTCRAGTTGGEPIAIRSLKRFVVDKVDPGIYRTVPTKARPGGPKVAIVGAGPAGLTAAHYLSQKGIAVTLLEREEQPGGMLICGIPEFRLPRDTLSREIGALLNDNITLKLGVSLGKDVTLEQLFEDGHRAVYLSTGAHRSKRLELEGEEMAGVIPSIAFLKAQNLKNQSLASGKVGIIGGGNSAIDAARVAIRQPGVSSVTIFYRRSQEEMPAYQEEIEGALEEGITLETLVSPVELHAQNGKLSGVTFIHNTLGPRDSSGRRAPIPLKGSEFKVPLETLIVAISEEPEAEAMSDVKRKAWGGIIVNEESLSTGRAGVFAGGDAVTGPNTVVDSIASGKRAALMIERYLNGKQLKLLHRVKLPSVYVEPITTLDEGSERAERVVPLHLPADARAMNFREVELSVAEQDAVCEARRCLRCDLEFTHPV